MTSTPSSDTITTAIFVSISILILIGFVIGYFYLTRKYKKEYDARRRPVDIDLARLRAANTIPVPPPAHCRNPPEGWV